MDIDTLTRLLTSSLHGDKFILDGTALGSPAVTAVLREFFGANQLALAGVSKIDVPAPAQPTVRGTLASTHRSPFGFLAGLSASARFSLDGAKVPQLLLIVTPAASGWQLSQALPSVKRSWFDKFAWNAPRFSIDSQTPAALDKAFPTKYGLAANSPAILAAMQRGVSFSSQLALVSAPGAIDELIYLLGGRAFTVSGAIEWYGALPRLALASPSIGVLKLGGFTLTTGLDLIAVLTEVDNPQTPVVSMPLAVFNATLERGTFKLPVQAQLFGGFVGMVEVVGNFAEASSLALAEVASLVGLGSLDDQAPPPSFNFPLLGDLELESVRLRIASRALLSVAATVRITKSGGWSIFGDLFVFDGLTVTFTVTNPLATVSVETAVDARVTLAGGELDGWAILPSLRFGCDLAAGSTIDLTEVVNAMVGGPFGMPAIVCDKLTVLGDVQAGEYRFIAEAKGSLGLDFGGGQFGLTSIGFDLRRRNNITSGQIVGELLLAGVPVRLATTYRAGAGWTFNGGTQGEQHISLTDLLAELLDKFNLALPTNAPQVMIHDVSVMLQPATLDFGFSVEGSFSLADHTVGVSLDLGREHDDANATIAFFDAYLQIGPALFHADFNSTPTGQVFTFTWSDTDEPLEFSDVAEFFGCTLPSIPENLDLALTAASFTYDFSSDVLVLSATSKNYGSITFVSDVVHGQRVFVFQLSVPAIEIDFAKLPVVGDAIGSHSFAIERLQVIYASSALAASDVSVLDALLPPSAIALPAGGLAAGFTVVASLDLDGHRVGAALPLSAPPPAMPSSPPASYSGPIKWLSLQTTIGPLQLQRIGVEYSGGLLSFLVDAMLDFGPLSLSLDGLGVGSPLTRFDLRFQLTGVSVAFSSPPLAIGGGLLQVTSPLPPAVAFEYLGALTVQAENLSIAAVGSYARVGNEPSLFVYAQVAGQFGGPPAFFITGLMGGFGYNSQLQLPDMSRVFEFPFVAGLDDPAVMGSASPTPLEVLDVLTGRHGQPAWVTPSAGDDWLALGVRFTSFELLHGKALLVATFGAEFQLALLGLASMSLPQTGTSYAYVELQLEAIFKPADGFFGVQSSLTPNSYVLDRSCHLTGGFAFFLWYAGVHAGDFVVTVGGYHPAFAAPTWYPRVDRLGFNWPVSSAVVIKGGAYLALTPTAVMAGGSLEVLFSDGDLNAWFTAWANVLIEWAPFAFQASIGVSVGASYRLNLLFTSVTLSVEIGASLRLWGPPTSGVVTVDWYIISFSVGFGASSGPSTPPPLGWSEFAALLPRKGIINVQANRGLLQVADDGTWMVRADELAFTVQSAVPATEIQLRVGTKTTSFAKAPALLSIRPMAQQSIASTHTLSLVKHEVDGSTTSIDLTAGGWTLTQQSANAPEAMWGAPLDGPPPPTANTVPVLTGLSATVPRTRIGPTTGAIEGIDYEPVAQARLPFDPATRVDPIAPPVPAPGSLAIIAATLATTSVAARDAIFAALGALGSPPPANDPLDALATGAGLLFPLPPMLAS